MAYGSHTPGKINNFCWDMQINCYFYVLCGEVQWVALHL